MPKNVPLSLYIHVQGSLSGKAKFASLGSEPLSQFQLLEESGHLTVPSGVPSAPPLERQTEVVFK